MISRRRIARGLQAALCGGLIAALLVGHAAAQESSTGVRLDMQIVPTGKKLEREAFLVLTDAAGKPIANADIAVLVDMPSMPMMHRVPKKKAEPTAEAGKYRVNFTLEMPGEWAAHIQVVTPHAMQTVRKFTVD